eukprot:16347539-Heterocapsa_arctica.AAC.1
MGFALIYNYKKNPALAYFPIILNILETGLQTMMMTEDIDAMTEADGEEHNEDMDKCTMTEEDMNNTAETMMNKLMPELQNIEGRIESLENTHSASKEFTYIMYNDAESIFYTETLKIRDRIKDMFSRVKKNKSNKEDTDE